jgi:hypothetical protein
MYPLSRFMMTEQRITATLTQITLSDSRRKEQKDNIQGRVVVAGEEIEAAVVSRRLVQQYFAEHKTHLDSLSGEPAGDTVSLMLDIGSPQPAKLDGVLSKGDRDSVDISMPIAAFQSLVNVSAQATGSTTTSQSQTSGYQDQQEDFWIWDKSIEKWTHVDSDSGTVICCPDELD